MWDAVRRLIAISCLFIAAGSARADDAPVPHAAGSFVGIRFTEILVQEARDKRIRQAQKLGWETALDAMKPAQLSYDLYVPKSYHAGLPHGVIVCFDALGTEKILTRIADERSFLILTPGDLGVDKLTPVGAERYAAHGLNGLLNLEKIYTVDTSRVYVIGNPSAGMVMGLNAPNHVGGVMQIQRHAWHMKLSNVAYVTQNTRTYDVKEGNDQRVTGIGTEVVEKKQRVTLPPTVPEPLYQAERDARKSLRLVFVRNGADLFGQRPENAAFTEAPTKEADAPELKRWSIYARARELYDSAGFASVTYDVDKVGMEKVVVEGVAFMDEKLVGELRLVNRHAEEAERNKEFGTAMYHYYRADILGDEKAGERLAPLLALLNEKMQEARDLQAAGKTEESEKLLRKIIKIYGLAAYDAYVMLKANE